MKKLIFILIPFFLYGATVSVTDVTVADSGLSVNATIEGIDTGGTWNFNRDSIGTPTDSTPYITVVSHGYDQAGARVWNNRKIYIDTVYRKNYPLNGYDSCFINGSDTAWALHPHEPIFKDDTVKAVWFPKGMYINGTDSSAEYDVATATNNSEITYATHPVWISWSCVPRQIINSNFQVSVIAYHPSADSGRMVRAVIFSAADEHSHTVYDTVTTAARGIDNADFNDSLCLTEYVSTINISSFTSGDTISVNAKVFPKWGDSIWTGDGVYSWPTPFYTTHKYYYWDQRVAVVSESGNDGSGALTTLSAFDTASPPAAYRTWGGAVTAMRAAAGVTDIKGGRIYTRAGTYNNWGSTITAGTFSTFWLEVRNWPGETVYSDSIGGSQYMPADSWVKWHGITMTLAYNTNFAGSTEKGFWLDSCIDQRTNGAIGAATTLIWETNNKFVSRAQNIPYSGQNASLVLSRGNEYLHSATAYVVPVCFVANKITHQAAVRFKFDFDGMLVPLPEGSIIGWNHIKINSELMSAFNDSSCDKGILLINNVIESYTNTGAIMSLSVDTTMRYTNYFGFVNNTIVGGRYNRLYQDVTLNDSTNIRWQKYGCDYNNIYCFSPIITDVHDHGGDPGNKRFGNFFWVFGTMNNSNIFCVTPPYLIDNYGFQFMMDTVASGGIQENSNVNRLPAYVDDASLSGTNDGGGDYHLADSSYAIGYSRIWQLPFDLDGNARTDSGAVGVYSGDGEGGSLPPTVTVDPTQLHDTLGQTDTVTVTVTGTEPFTYQWQIYNGGWADTTGETNDSLFYLVTLDKSGDSIRVIVTNSEGSDTSTAFEISVLWVEPPTITTDPQDTTLNTGRTAHFYIEYTGSPSTFQWQDSSAGGWANISGATDSTLDTTANNAITGYRYRCIVTNDSASDTSAAATLTVDPFTVSFDITGSGTASGDGDYDSLDTAFIELTPAANYHCVSDSLDTIVVTKDTTYQAIFGIDTYYVARNPGENGLMSTDDPDTIYAYGETARIIITPNSGYRIVGNQDSLPDTIQWVVTQDSTFSATFEAYPTFTVDSTIVNGLPDSVIFSHFGTVDSGTIITVTINNPADTQCTVSGDTSGVLVSFNDVVDANKSYTFTFDEFTDPSIDSVSPNFGLPTQAYKIYGSNLGDTGISYLNNVQNDSCEYWNGDSCSCFPPSWIPKGFYNTIRITRSDSIADTLSYPTDRYYIRRPNVVRP